MVAQQCQSAKAVQTDHGVDDYGAVSSLFQGKQCFVMQYVNDSMTPATVEEMARVVGDVKDAQFSGVLLAHACSPLLWNDACAREL